MENSIFTRPEVEGCGVRGLPPSISNIGNSDDDDGRDHNNVKLEFDGDDVRKVARNGETERKDGAEERMRPNREENRRRRRSVG